MKTIKIESIGQEPIVLNVPEGSKVSIEDGLTVVEPEKYIPKVGDCVKAQSNGSPVLFQIKSIEGNRFYNYTAIEDGEIMFRYKYWDICAKTVFTQITPEDLQSEFNKLGYEYNFETHRAKKLRWKPELYQEYYYVNSNCAITKIVWNNSIFDNNLFEIGNCYKDEKEADPRRQHYLLFKD